MTEIASNLAAVRSSIAEATELSGRPAGVVRFVLVTKTVDAERVREAIRAGAAYLVEHNLV